MSVTTPAPWTIRRIMELYELPFMDLVFQAQTVHRQHHPANQIQLSSLLSIKTGACPEDCSYCPQSSKYQTELEPEPLMPLEQVLEAARAAQASFAELTRIRQILPGRPGNSCRFGPLRTACET